MIKLESVITNYVNLYKSNKLPKFIVVSGISGSGKTTFVNFVTDRCISENPTIISNIEDVRAVCESAVTLREDKFYLLDKFDSMNFRAKEAVLKLCEDVPNHVYIFVETNDILNLKDTVKSRAHTISMPNYSKKDLSSFVDLLTMTDKSINITDVEMNMLVSAFSTPGDILRAYKLDINKLYSFCDKVLCNILSTKTFNCMNISESLKLKTDSVGYDMDLFFKALTHLIVNKYQDNKELFKIAFYNSTALNSLNNPSLSKLMIFDKWLFSVKGV